MQVKSLTKERQGKICLLLNISSLIIKSEVPLFILIKEIKVAFTSVATEVRVDYKRVPIKGTFEENIHCSI